ncbi:unnamed protein product [Prunus armeniaca]|uniref:THO complex subunitTHOC2 C-terminal domain-containing protein n=1 Tax=Prunus armeniaca TaxID=36596 RepID=A0A6J5UHU9_PRUAR|nr:unnamed protein product [Prunus armeniaca]
MANVHYTENLTEDQLDAMAGSETLRYQATSFGVTRNNKALIKSTNRLRDSLLPKDESKLAIPLLLLLAQHRSVCHGTLLQYVEFLCSAVTPTSAYAQLIPSLDDLVHQYHLDPEVAFLIYRPVMRLFKCRGSSDVFWPLDNNDTQGITSANSESEAAEHSGNLVLDVGSPSKPVTWLDLLNTVKTMLPPKAWNSLSPDLYATFWGLTLYDLYVPRNCYESEIAKQHAALKALEELSDNSHEENVASVRKRLSREKDKWLSSCPDTLKINVEFLQRCIFPRCTFSMPDAVYCAMFVHTLHSLGTPFFNTVNHIDILICRTLQPMICCCTEYEVGRFGKFLQETLKIAYYWKVHWKWSQRITKLLIQCLESTEYMEIRNALILLSKISSVFPVTRKTGVNLEKRVSKIKADEREDLKVLATGVAAALAARKVCLKFWNLLFSSDMKVFNFFYLSHLQSSWITDEEFGNGYLELKSAPLASKSSAGNSAATHSGSTINISQSEPIGGKVGALPSQHPESSNSVKDQILKTKTSDGRWLIGEWLRCSVTDALSCFTIWNIKIYGK